MKYLEYLFAGYALIWVVLFLYTASIGSKYNKLLQEVELLKRALEGKRRSGA